MDNLVVFSLIMTTYRVPPSLTRKAERVSMCKSCVPFSSLTGSVCWHRGLCPDEAWLLFGSLD